LNKRGGNITNPIAKTGALLHPKDMLQAAQALGTYNPHRENARGVSVKYAEKGGS